MKHIFMTALAAAMLLGACTSADEPTTQPGTTLQAEDETVRLTFSPYEVTGMTRAATSVGDYCSRLDIWISEGGNTQAFHQQAGDESFGSLSVALNKTKTYTLVAVAHKCTAAATLTEGVIAFPDTKLTHSMVYTTTFSPATVTALNCVMQRMVGMFRLETTDAVPDDCKKMRFVFTCNDRWNVATATSQHSDDKVVTLNIGSLAQDGTASFSVYIMPDNMTNVKEVNVTVTGLTATDEEVETKTFSAVPVRAGYKSTYRGAFFTTEAVSSLFIVEDWSAFDTVNY